MRRHFICTTLIAFLPLAVVADDAVAPLPSASPTTEASSAPAPKAATVRWVPNDQRRTLRSYGSNLAYNALGVVTPGNRMPLLVTAALTAPAFAWDDEVIGYFGKHPHENFGKIGANLGGGIAVAGLTVGFFSAGRFSHGDRFRATTYDLSQAIIVNEAWTEPRVHGGHDDRAALSQARDPGLRRSDLYRHFTPRRQETPCQRHRGRRGLRLRRGTARGASEQPAARGRRSGHQAPEHAFHPGRAGFRAC